MNIKIIWFANHTKPYFIHNNINNISDSKTETFWFFLETVDIVSCKQKMDHLIIIISRQLKAYISGGMGLHRAYGAISLHI